MEGDNTSRGWNRLSDVTIREKETLNKRGIISKMLGYKKRGNKITIHVHVKHGTEVSGRLEVPADEERGCV